MGKVLLYASIAVTLATAALGFINKGKLSTTKEELATSEKAVADKPTWRKTKPRWRT